MRHSSARIALVTSVCLLACGEASPAIDGAIEGDAGARDAALGDAGAPMDGGARDGGASDGGALDASMGDASTGDAATGDAGEGSPVAAGDCRPDGWCWEYPRPFGEAIRAMATFGGDHWLVGSDGLVAARDATGAHRRVHLASAGGFNDVLAFDGTLFVVGDDNAVFSTTDGVSWTDASDAAHDGVDWRRLHEDARGRLWIIGGRVVARVTGGRPVTSVTFDEHVYDIDSDASGIVHVVGDFGLEAFYEDFDGWTDAQPGVADLIAVHVFDDGTRWLLSDNGRIVERDASGTGTLAHDLGRVVATPARFYEEDATTLWLTAHYLFDPIRFDAREPTVVDLDTTGAMYVVAEHDGARWIGGTSGQLFRAEGAGWTRVSGYAIPHERSEDDEPSYLHHDWRFWVSPTGEVWAAGQALVRGRDGVYAPFAHPLDRATVVVGVDDDDVWIGGVLGEATAAAHWDGTSWDAPETVAVFGGRAESMQRSAEGTLWIGSDGGVYRRGGSGWTFVSGGSATSNALHLAARADDDVWVSRIASTPSLVHYDGATWSPRTEGLDAVYDGSSFQAWSLRHAPSGTLFMTANRRVFRRGASAWELLVAPTLERWAELVFPLGADEVVFSARPLSGFTTSLWHHEAGTLTDLSSPYRAEDVQAIGAELWMSTQSGYLLRRAAP